MIGDVIAAALPIFRASAESLMTDVCDIDRGTTAWDEVLQESVTTWTSVHADVPCHVESPPVSSQTILTGESVVAESPVVHVSYLLGGIEPDDRVTVSGGDIMWVTRAAPDDATHPVEVVIQCRWDR
jgi:hypothetical protein